MNILMKSLAIAAMSIAMLAPAKAANEIGDVVQFHYVLALSSMGIGCTQVRDAYGAWSYQASRGTGIFAYETWASKVNALSQPGRYCMMVDMGSAKFQIVAKKYGDYDNFNPRTGQVGISDTKPAKEALTNFLCIKRKDGPAFPNDACLWVTILERQ